MNMEEWLVSLEPTKLKPLIYAENEQELRRLAAEMGRELSEDESRVAFAVLYPLRENGGDLSDEELESVVGGKNTLSGVNLRDFLRERLEHNS